MAPAASGLLFTRIYKGLRELSLLGLIDENKTHMYVAQPAGCAPIANAFASGSLRVQPVVPETITRSLAIGNPEDGYSALMVARMSGGGACAVSDQEAIAGLRLLAETEGIFAEAAGGVVIAGLRKLVASGAIKRNDLTVAVITGAGPRTQDVLSEIVKPIAIRPSIESAEEALAVSAKYQK